MPVTVTPIRLPAIPPPAPVPEAHGPAPRGLWARWAPIATLAVLLIGAAVAVLRPQFWSAPISTIVASGRIEGRDVTIASKDIQGRVKSLLVDEGQSVTRGQLLAELDAAQLDARDRTIAAGIGAHDAQLAQAALDIDYAAKNAAAGVAAAEAFLSGAQARLVRATAVLANAQADDERAAALYVARRVSKQR